jgi:hypothetical protein
MVHRVGLTSPAQLVGGSAGGLPPQYLALLTQAAEDLIARHDWEVMLVEHSFTTVAGQHQFSIFTDLPTYKRMAADTVVNVTTGRFMKHMSREAHTALKLSPSPMVLDRYRLRGGDFLMPGNTVSGETVEFEYMSRGWLANKDTLARQTTALTDRDLVLLDEEALIRGAKWLFKKEKGLAYGEDFNDYERYIKDLKGGDTPTETLSIGATSSHVGSGFGNIHIDAD